MANLRAIRTRIKSVQNTQQITKSMKMVAAAKLRRTQTAFSSLRRYSDTSAAILQRVGCCEADSPCLARHSGNRSVCYVLIVGNRGLCGGYNTGLVRFFQKRLEDEEREAFLVVAGRWGKDVLATLKLPLRRSFEISDTPSAAEARELSEYLRGLYLEGEADEVVLVYQKFRSVLSQEPCCETLLPLETTPGNDDTGWIFEPDRASLLETLVKLNLDNRVHAVLLEARTGEHASRMTAMTAASDNTEELIDDLTLQLNHARQAAITTEITEIVGGAEALRAKP